MVSPTAPIPPEDALLTNEQATAAVTKIKTLHKPLPKEDLQALLRSLPSLSPERQSASLQETPLDLSAPASKPLELLPTSTDPHGGPSTILYLAYGSNLAAETFLGKRGIRPLSQTTVAVPSLVMTFDLPGIPYTEPCFANTAYRHPSKPSPPPSSTPSSPSEKSPLLPSSPTKNSGYHNPSWPKPMVGVVYEVTPSDFAHIIATEGGGASYQDVLVDCHPLHADTSLVPSHPTTPPFKAHTLFSPTTPPGTPTAPDHGRFSRPDPNYAQPSLRYLNLLRDGAEEHGLPSEYRAYLDELQPYRITTQKQALGRFVFAMVWSSLVMGVFKIGRLFHDKNGRSPGWLARLMGAIFRGVWMSYDGLFEGIFGDGERTQEREGGEDGSVGREGVEGEKADDLLRDGAVV